MRTAYDAIGTPLTKGARVTFTAAAIKRYPFYHGRIGTVLNGRLADGELGPYICILFGRVTYRVDTANLRVL